MALQLKSQHPTIDSIGYFPIHTSFSINFLSKSVKNGLMVISVYYFENIAYWMKDAKLGYLLPGGAIFLTSVTEVQNRKTDQFSRQKYK